MRRLEDKCVETLAPGIASAPAPGIASAPAPGIASAPAPGIASAICRERTLPARSLTIRSSSVLF